MKKPLNRAISPIPPYGELAPVCGTSWSPIPNTTAQPMNRNVNRNFAFGLVIRRAQRDGALGGHRRLEDDPDHQADDDGRDPERDGLLEGDQESCTRAMLADGRRPERRAAGTMGRPAIRPAPEANHCRDPLRSTWAVRRAPRVVGRRGVGRAAAGRPPVRAAGPGRAERRRVHPRRPRVGAREGAARDRARRAAVGARRRLQQPDARGRHARRSRPRPPAAMRDIPDAPHVARVVSHTLAPRQVSRRPPHGLRHRLPRPAARRLARRAADPARATPRRRRVSTSRWPAGPPSTATSRPCRRPTSSGASSSRCRSPRWPCSSSSARSSRRASRSSSAARRSSSPWRGIFLVASVTPMSIFVLNLATLLGLGLGVDYSLLLTSRFREELALRPEGPDRVAEAVRVTVATAGRAVFFSGLTVLLGLLGLVLFEFMILRSVGIAGAIVVGLAVASALTLLPAILTILGPRIDRLARPPGVGGRRPTDATAPGRGSPGGSCATRSRCSSRRCCSCSCSARRSCTSGSTPRTRRSCRPRSPSRAAFDRLQAEFGEGEFAPIVLAIRTDGPATDAGQPGRPVRLLAPPRGGPARRPRRQPRRRRPAADARAVPAALRRPERAARPLRADRAGRDDPRRPDGVHAHHAATARTATRDGRSSPTCGRRAAPLAPPAGMTVAGRWRRRGRGRRRRPRPGRLPADRAVHHRLDLPRPVRPPALGRPAGQGAGDEHAVDRGQLRGAGLDLPGRQPVRRCSASSRSGSSRRPSR